MAESEKLQRCGWCGDDPLYQQYHDLEWGVPLFDDQRLFELLNLEGAQAGLSWITILKKRLNYRAAFDGFDPEKIARYGERQYDALMQDAGIVRNRAKIRAVINNAQCYLALREEGHTFAKYLWSFCQQQPITNHFASPDQVPATSDTSHAMSRALRQRGFKFVGPTICYAFMQSCGMVNDHLIGCFRHRPCADRAQHFNA